MTLLQARLAAETTKRKRLAFLLSDHAYLPDAEIASLAGCSLSGVEKGRRRTAKPTACLEAIAA